jgi:hypothetical protein
MADDARKLIVLAAGVGTRSGDTHRVFAGFRGFMQGEPGFEPHDFVEATYGGRHEGGRWVGPAEYDLSAFDAPLATTIVNTTEALLHESRRRPPSTEWHLVGFSFGGLVLLEAAILLQRRAPEGWGRGLRTITTLSSPLNGVALGEWRWLGDLFGQGAVSAELSALGENPAHRRRLAAAVDRLRAQGVTVTTLAEADDAVVLPKDAIIGPVLPSLVVQSSSSAEASPVARHLGHGRIVNAPFVWERLLALIGPQTGAGGRDTPRLRARPIPPPSDVVLITPPPSNHVLITPPPASATSRAPADARAKRAIEGALAEAPRLRDEELLDAQLAELKARMRAEGKL